MNWLASLRKHSGQPRSTAGGGAVTSRPPLWNALRFWSNRHRALTSAARYLASVAGVLAVTWIISLVLPRYRIANISMIYLLLVLALAVWAGSGPAILASVGSFLAFDWFFVPPVGR